MSVHVGWGFRRAELGRGGGEEDQQQQQAIDLLCTYGSVCARTVTAARVEEE